MNKLALYICLIIASGCSTPATYETWSRYNYDGYAYLMYSRPRNIVDTSTQVIDGQFFFPINLVNMKGNVIHQWNAGCPVAHAELSAGYTLAVACFMDVADRTQLPPGSFEKIKIIDRDSKLIQSYVNVRMHHTFSKKENNLLTIQNRILNKNEIKKLKLKPPSLSKDVWSDIIVEVNSDGEIVWTWDFIDDGQAQVGDFEFDNHNDLTHGNSIMYYSKSAISKNPIVVVSFRNISSVLIIDYITKKIVWRSKPKVFSRQHDATIINQDTLLVFDNDSSANESKSKVVTINLVTGKLEVAYEQSYFSVAKMGAVQHIMDDRFLITDSQLGYAFEVSSKKDLLFYIWNKHININKDIKVMKTDVDGFIFSPVYKIKMYNINRL